MMAMNERFRIHRHNRKGWHRAAAALFGTVVGAGILALPHAVAVSGVAIGAFWLIALAIVALITHLVFGEVVMHTPGKHRLVGYIGMYLGKWQKDLQALASILGLLGGSLAYLILGGLFLSQILDPIVVLPPEVWSVVMFAFVAYTCWRGVNFMARVDFWLSLALAFVFVIIIGKSFYHLEPANLQTVDISNGFLPYGLVIFAYSGLSAITEMKDIIHTDKLHTMRFSIIVGTLAAAVLTTLFTIATVGALGPETSPEAIAGLADRFGGVIPFLGAAAGFFAVITSYIVFSLYLREQFEYDFKWRPSISWGLTMFLPFIFFIFGVRSFGAVLSIAGGVLGGVTSIFVLWTYFKVKKKYGKKVLHFPAWLIWLLVAAYAAGALYQLYFQLM